MQTKKQERARNLVRLANITAGLVCLMAALALVSGIVLMFATSPRTNQVSLGGDSVLNYNDETAHPWVGAGISLIVGALLGTLLILVVLEYVKLRAGDYLDDSGGPAMPPPDLRTLPPPALTDPGWLADPLAPGQRRWWDGRAWTDHVTQPVP